MTLLPFRPQSIRTLDFLMVALAVALRKQGRITLTQEDLTNPWKKERVVFHYLADGSIRFELERADERKAGP